MDQTRPSRRSILRLALVAPVAGAGLAACGTSGPQKAGGGGGGGGGGASYWYLSGAPGEKIRTDTVNRFNQANPNAKIAGTTFQNDAYKTRIRTAVGAGQAPTVIWGWGGGTLRSYVESQKVEDLTSWFKDNPKVKNRLFPSAFGAATVDGKIYAMPCETVQPIVLYYNKKLFDQIGAKPPQSWGDIMDLVPKFNAKKIAPFSLGGQSLWTNMMWLEFLFDRIAGPGIFEAAAAGEPNAWSAPGAIDALGKVQDLVKAKGFIHGFSSITADSNADQALLYTGKAAMMLHGSWCYGSMAADGGSFVKDGQLGYMNFPGVDGGKGDLSDTVGNPGQYLSISSNASAKAKATAKKFFADSVLSSAEVKEWIDTGNVPIVKGSQSGFSGSSAGFLKFIYGVSANAKTFAQSWDQALDPTAATKLLDNIGKLFQLSISPKQFADSMNKVTAK